MLRSHPAIGSSLVANIPRLETVAEIIGYQNARFNGRGGPADGKKGTEIPIGARILKVALDFDTLTAAGLSSGEAFLKLHERVGWYDADVLSGLEAVGGIEESYEVREVRIRELTGQMILVEDVKTVTGVLVICKGHEVTQYLRARLRNYALHAQIREPIRVFIKPERSPVAVAHSRR
jgi:hypothetical protein